MLQLLRQETAILVEDTKPIQKIYKQIRTQLASELATTLTPAAFIELSYLWVQTTQKCIADRRANQQAMM